VKFGEIVNLPDFAKQGVNPCLYDDVLGGFKGMCDSIDGFTGQFRACINEEDPLRSRFKVSLNRELPEGCQDVSPAMLFNFSPTDGREEVQNHFAYALDHVGRIEKEIEALLYEANIGSRVPEKIRQEIRKDAETLFGEKTPAQPTELT
jgi:hypothetical protein